MTYTEPCSCYHIFPRITISRKILGSFSPSKSRGRLTCRSENLPPAIDVVVSQMSCVNSGRPVGGAGSAVVCETWYVLRCPDRVTLTVWCWGRGDAMGGYNVLSLIALWANVVILSWTNSILHCVFLPGLVNYPGPLSINRMWHALFSCRSRRNLRIASYAACRYWPHCRWHVDDMSVI